MLDIQCFVQPDDPRHAALALHLHRQWASRHIRQTSLRRRARYAVSRRPLRPWL